MPGISVSSIPIPFTDDNVVLSATLSDVTPENALIDTDGIFIAANDDGDYILTSD